MSQTTGSFNDHKDESFVDDLHIPLQNVGLLSELLPATGVLFRKVVPTYEYNFEDAARSININNNKPSRVTRY